MDLTGNRKGFSFLVYFFFTGSASTTGNMFMSEVLFLGNCMCGLTRAVHEISAISAKYI